ncbi:MAG: DNA topology modulation protein FlaR [Bacilli bacterium]
MKIQIAGFSGSGKSTFASRLGAILNLPVIHLDAICLDAKWKNKPNEEILAILTSVLRSEDWIIDGNYRRISPNRYDDCDLLFYFNFNRFVCLYSAIKRNKTYRKEHKKRADAPLNVENKMTFEFFMWIIYEGRKKQRQKLREFKNKYNDKLIIFKNRSQVNKYLETFINLHNNIKEDKGEETNGN